MRPPSRFSASFELVVVAVRVLGAFIVVVFVDEDAFLIGEGLVAVPAPVAFTTQDERAEYRSGEELGDPPPQGLTGRGQRQPGGHR
jgi:hypothetical protein